MAELTAGRATNVRLAQAMGYVRLTTSLVEYWWWGRPSDAGAYEPCGTVRLYEDFLDEGKAEEDSDTDLPDYLTDPAQVTPMVDRLAELLGDQATVHLIRYGDGGWDVRMDGCMAADAPYNYGEFEASTANEAAAKALLWAWEREKGEGNGGN